MPEVVTDEGRITNIEETESSFIITVRDGEESDYEFGFSIHKHDVTLKPQIDQYVEAEFDGSNQLLLSLTIDSNLIFSRSIEEAVILLAIRKRLNEIEKLESKLEELRVVS